MNSNFSPGVLWTTIASVLPLVVAFVTGLSQAELIPATWSAIIIVCINAAVRIGEIVKTSQGSGPQPLGSAAPSGSAAAARGAVARFFVGG